MPLSPWDDIVSVASSTSINAKRPTVLLLSVSGDVHQIGLHTMAAYLLAAGIPVLVRLNQSMDDMLACMDSEIKIVLVSGLLQTGFDRLSDWFLILNNRGIKVPFIVGGGMLTESYVARYLAGRYQGPIGFARYPAQAVSMVLSVLSGKLFESVVPISLEDATAKPSDITGSTVPKWEPTPIPKVCDFSPRMIDSETIDSLWSWISPRALYQLHLGYRGNFEKALASRQRDAVRLEQKVQGVLNRVRSCLDWFQPMAIVQYFRVRSDRDAILFLGDLNQIRYRLPVPRQNQAPYLCLSDWVSPDSDILPCFVTTVLGVNQIASKWFHSGEIESALIVQHLACQIAEAFAEKLHYQLRCEMAISSQSLPSISDLMDARYQGKRFSFGYPACPNLSDQTILFQLLKPEVIGVKLTDISMMDPECTVSAMVFHHPNARYFGTLL